MSPIVLYQAINLTNGKRYVGITKQGLATRVYKHHYKARKGQGQRLGAAIRKYGKDRIIFSVLVICPDYRYALDMEMAYIAAIKPEYNVTAGGEGVLGLRLSEETRAKLGAVNRGNKYWVGRKHTAETVEKLRQRMIGTVGHWHGKKRPDMIEKTRARMLANPINYWLGKKRSQETKDKIAATKKAAPKREPTDKEQAARSQCIRLANAARLRSVVCINTGETFDSMAEAATRFKVHRTNIWFACRNPSRKVKGMEFRYAPSD